jgi:hypothetical protein
MSEERLEDDVGEIKTHKELGFIEDIDISQEIEVTRKMLLGLIKFLKKRDEQ